MLFTFETYCKWDLASGAISFHLLDPLFLSQVYQLPVLIALNYRTVTESSWDVLIAPAIFFSYMVTGTSISSSSTLNMNDLFSTANIYRVVDSVNRKQVW